jgi:hypothetical protein
MRDDMLTTHEQSERRLLQLIQMGHLLGQKLIAQCKLRAKGRAQTPIAMREGLDELVVHMLNRVRARNGANRQR